MAQMTCASRARRDAAINALRAAAILDVDLVEQGLELGKARLRVG